MYLALHTTSTKPANSHAKSQVERDSCASLTVLKNGRLERAKKGRTADVYTFSCCVLDFYF
jgi:hypothetical protein